ncbi:hypothetical protein OG689_26185 [Kitasatospora sp. NBC_00240]|uniref:hypothetical protein n=1 Tax=Kitasatospora sp. NBC_00240 TaxID=2903567 RepID=UPI00224D46A8|nr:hypothetical protein [Kitasatospora sp. NBC_00240]MCX5212730.1 hypothetical protein [Kitasatospora sp. NBC_00240]
MPEPRRPRVLVRPPRNRPPRGGRGPGGERVAGEPGAERPAGGLGPLLRKAAYVVAPGTVVVGLLYYFGSTYTAAYYAFFGVPTSDLSFSVQAYLGNSTNAVFLPLWFLLCCGLTATLVLGLADGRLGQAGSAAVWRRIRPGLFLAGLVVLLLGFAVFLEPAWWSHSVVSRLQPGWPRELIPPLVVAAGAGLAIVAVSLRRLGGRPPQEGLLGERVWTAAAAFLVAMLVLTVFFALARYAGDAGRAKAGADAGSGFKGRAFVLVYLRHPMVHDVTGIAFQDMGEGGGPFRYRYAGFVVLAKSASRYYLVSHEWRPGNDVTVVLPDDDSVRVEVRGDSARYGE